MVFYSDAQARLPHESISFEAGQCVAYDETFDAGTGGGGTGAYVCVLTIKVLSPLPSNAKGPGEILHGAFNV